MEQRTLIAQPEVGTRFIVPSQLPKNLEPQARTQSVWESGSLGSRNTNPASAQVEPNSQDTDLQFRCNLLRHVIFQQVLTLIQLDAREQAMQIIDTCNKS